MRTMLRMQGNRIREVETSSIEEHERTNAFREQTQESNGRLVRVVREVMDRTKSMLTECGVLIEEVIQVNLAEESQGNVALNESDIEPEEGQAEPEGEVESASSVMN